MYTTVQLCNLCNIKKLGGAWVQGYVICTVCNLITSLTTTSSLLVEFSICNAYARWAFFQNSAGIQGKIWGGQTIHSWLSSETTVKSYSHHNAGTGSQQQAICLLTQNTKSLIHAVGEVLYAAERAIIKLPASEVERLGLIHQTTPELSPTPCLGKLSKLLSFI